MTATVQPSRRGRCSSGEWVPRRLASAVALACALSLGPRMVSGAEGPTERTPPRVSVLDGEVSFWRPGAEDWAAARVNLPLAPGDYLYTGPHGRLELQVSRQGFLRAAAETELSLEQQEGSAMVLSVAAGEVSLDLRATDAGEAFVLRGPDTSFRIGEPGYYRMDVDGDRTRFAVHQGGRATILQDGAQSSTLASGEQAEVENGRLSIATAPASDAWDRWNDERTAAVSSSESARYVPDGVYGVDTLDQYGAWQQQARYGWVWVPRAVPAGWAPYGTGRWLWDPYYGWTWVDDAPWGWAPYHYGRWVYVSNYWAWSPGPALYPPVYAPALVAFFGGGSIGVSVGVGVPYVGWVALGWGEPVIPWWGPRGFYGRPCWAGWGGPRVVNNVFINKTTIVNAKDLHHYQNTRIRDGVIAMRREQFARTAVARGRITHADLHDLKPIIGRPPVESSARDLVEASGRGRRPPETRRERAEAGRHPPRAAVAAPPEEREATRSGRRPQPSASTLPHAASARPLPPPLPRERVAQHGGSARRLVQGDQADAQRLRASRSHSEVPLAMESERRAQPPPLPGSSRIERRAPGLVRPEREAALSRGSPESTSRPGERADSAWPSQSNGRPAPAARPQRFGTGAAPPLPERVGDVRSIPARQREARRSLRAQPAEDGAARVERAPAVRPVSEPARWQQQPAPPVSDARRTAAAPVRPPARFAGARARGDAGSDAPGEPRSGAGLRDLRRGPVTQQARHARDAVGR